MHTEDARNVTTPRGFGDFYRIVWQLQAKKRWLRKENQRDRVYVRGGRRNVLHCMQSKNQAQNETQLICVHREYKN